MNDYLTEGALVVPDALTSQGLGLLSTLSTAHESQARASKWREGWGDFGVQDDPTLKGVQIFTTEFESALLSICGSNSATLGGLTYPQLAYSWQIATPGDFNWHVDGAPDRTKCASQYRVLVGALINNVGAESDGAFMYHKGSHTRVREKLMSMPDELLNEALWNVAGKPLLSQEPVPFLGKAGDAVICNHLLVHGTASRLNTGSRRMAFFRLGFRLYPIETTVAKSTITSL